MKLNLSNEILMGLATCLGLMSFGYFIGNVCRPALKRFIIRKSDNFAPNSEVRESLAEMSFPVYRKFYMFNITNPEGIMAGEKPTVQEIGPYVFELWYHRRNVEDNEIEDTMVFDRVPTWYFNREMTAPLTGDEKLTVFHVVLTAGLVRTIRETPGLMDLIKDGLNHVFNYPKDPFMHLTAYELLWDGLYVNCNQGEFSAKAVCGALGAEKQVEKVNSTTFRMSLFKQDNDTTEARYKVHRGKKALNKLNHIVEINGEEALNLFDQDFCNEIRGTEGLHFPPFPKTSKMIEVFFADVCRSYGFKYAGKGKVDHFSSMKFVRETYDDRLPPYQCFCREDLDTCPPRGVNDISICKNGPFVTSNPHFYDADPGVLEKVNGLSPSREKHESFIHLHPVMGAVMQGSHKFQLNLDLEPVEAHPCCAKVPKMYMPFFWVEITGQLQGESWGPIIMMRWLDRILNTIKYLFVLTGLGIGAFTVLVETKLIGGSKPVVPDDTLPPRTTVPTFNEESEGFSFQYGANQEAVVDSDEKGAKTGFMGRLFKK